MNIYFNKPVTEEYLSLFKQMEEFVWHYLKDKEDFYKIKLYYYEYDDKKLALQNYNRCTDYLDKYKFRIEIYNYGFMTFHKGNDKENFREYEKNKYLVLFHELGHMVFRLNNQDIAKDKNEYEIKMKKQGVKSITFLNIDEEKFVTDQAKEFIKRSGLFEEEL